MDLHPQLARRADRGHCDSGIRDFHFHADARNGFFVEQHDASGADAGGGYRDRRCHHRARKHFSLHGREGKRPHSSGHRSHQRDWSGGHGHDALACDYFPAHCVHDRVCAEVRELLRVDHGHGHHGIVAGGLHADPDDEFADVKVGWPREESPFRRIPAFR